MKLSEKEYHLPIIMLILGTLILFEIIYSIKIDGIWRGPGFEEIITKKNNPTGYFEVIGLFSALSILLYWGSFWVFYLRYKKREDTKSLKQKCKPLNGLNRSIHKIDKQFDEIQQALKKLAKNRDQYNKQDYKLLRSGYIEGLKRNSSFNFALLVSVAIAFGMALVASVYLILSTPTNRFNLMSITSCTLALVLGLTLFNITREYCANKSFSPTDLKHFLNKLKADGLLSEEDINDIIDRDRGRDCP